MGVSEDYRARLAGKLAELQRMDRQFIRIGNARLAGGLLLAVAAWLAFGQQWISPWWMAPPAAAFLGLIVLHEKTVRTRRDAARSVRFYERGLERIEARWQGKGEAGEDFRDLRHIYSEDLDLFGKGSLFELLNTARTRGGEKILADWLLAPAGIDEAKARQSAVLELRPRLDLRESLALLGENVRAGLHPETLSQWASRATVRFGAATRLAALLAAGATILTLMLFFAGMAHLWPFLVMLLLDLGWMLFAWPRIRVVIESMEAPAKDLDLLSSTLERLEREHFESPYLQEIEKRIRSGSRPASRSIRDLRRLVVRLDWARNQLFAPIALLLLWHLQIAISIERWRLTHGPDIAAWMAAVGQMEALCALSGYSFEHPDDPFPDLTRESAGFSAEQLGHPLLAEAAAVRNDLELGGGTRLLIVSGSNMSGKSTLLRAVGLNTVLAWAGAPVRAKRLSVSPLQVGASIRVQDSLQDGKSRFYAEITRLRQLSDRSVSQPPLLFLIDEMLSGTNSHDRRIGAEAILRSLLDAGSLGLVTTHDLALAEMVGTLPGHPANVHFEDTLRDGKLTFDYRLRTGVVQHSNALELMRGLGLLV